jgi:hypothetical protein
MKLKGGSRYQGTSDDDESDTDDELKTGNYGIDKDNEEG